MAFDPALFETDPMKRIAARDADLASRLNTVERLAGYEGDVEEPVQVVGGTASVSFDSGGTVIPQSVSHGLGQTPSAVVVCGGSSTIQAAYGAYSIGSSSFTVGGQRFSPTSGSSTVRWVAVA